MPVMRYPERTHGSDCENRMPDLERSRRNRGGLGTRRPVRLSSAGSKRQERESCARRQIGEGGGMFREVCQQRLKTDPLPVDHGGGGISEDFSPTADGSVYLLDNGIRYMHTGRYGH